MPVQQVAPIVCSTCNAQFTAPVHNIINGQDAAMKAAFLQGQVNVVQCPQCSSVSSAAIPIFYYDLEKELAFALTPSQLNLTGSAQDKMIGKLTNSVVDSLPTEQRKFYLLNPKLFLSLESMAKAILEADGITEEVMEAQAARMKLLEEFFKISDEAALKEKVKAHDAELNYEFFEMLTAYMQAAQAGGKEAQAQNFLGLRTILTRLSTNGKEHVAKIDAEFGIVTIQSQEDLLEKMQNAKDDQELEALIATGHAMLDYTFFQKLTAKIDQAAKSGDAKTAETLKALRSDVLDIKAKHEEQGRAAVEKAANLLKEILQSERPDKALEQKLDQIDEAFFFILQTNIEEAQRQKQNESAQALEMIGHMAMSMLQARHTPEAQPVTSDQ